MRFFLLLLWGMVACIHQQVKNPETVTDSSVGTQSEDDGNSATRFFMKAEALVSEGYIDDAIKNYESAEAKDPESAYIKYKLSKAYQLNNEFEKAENKFDQIDFKSISNPKFKLEVKNFIAAFYLDQEKYEKALPLLKEIIKDSPDNGEANLALGQYYFEKDQLDLAEKHIKVFDESSESKNPMGKIYFAEILKKRKKFKQALSIYEDIVAMYPTFSQARINLALLYSQMGQEEKAIFHFETLANSFTNNPGSAGILKKLVNYFIEKKQMDKVEIYLNKIYTSEPDDLNIAVRFGMVLIQNSKPEEAIFVFEDLLKKVPDSDRVLYYLGTLYQQLGKKPEASERYGSIPETSEFYFDAQSNLAILLKEDQPDKSIEIVSNLEKIKDDDIQTVVLKSEILEKTKGIDSAIEYLESRRNKTFNSSVRFLYYLGNLYDQKNDFTKSISVMKEVISKDSKFSQAFNYIGYVYLTELKDLKNARVFIEKAEKIDGDDPYILDSYGWLLYNEGKFKQAKEILTKAVAKKPDEGIIVEHLADVHRSLQFLQEAMILYKQAVSLYNPEKEEENIKLVETKIQTLETDLKRLPSSKSE